MKRPLGKVLTITPNPALDLGGVADEIRPNEKSYVQNENWSPGGNAINVARILNRLKVPVVASGFLGGSTGQEIKNFLQSEGVQSQFIQINGRTRVNVTVSNKTDHRQTRLSFPGPKVQAKDKINLLKLLEKQKDLSHLVIGGSLPPGFSATDVIEIIKLAQDMQVLTVVDCPAKVLKKVIPHKPFLIKPNLEEFHQLTGTKAKTVNEVMKASRSLLKHVNWVCVSSVENGALLLTQQEAYFGKAPKVKVRSTVGAGDSMVAGMVAELFSLSDSVENIFASGLASAAASLEKPGTAFGSARDIQFLKKKVIIKKI
jgi:1-phosphofructokinase family hexose kinase